MTREQANGSTRQERVAAALQVRGLRGNETLADLVADLRAYFDDRADLNNDDRPNVEMDFLTRITDIFGEV